MNEIQFPKRRSDQSFVVTASFTLLHSEVLPHIQDYVAAWMRTKSTWTRTWRSDVIREEQWDFYSEFLLAPRVEGGPEDRTFNIVFEGRPNAIRWKDWVVYLVSDVTKQFPESTFVRFES